MFTEVKKTNIFMGTLDKRLPQTSGLEQGHKYPCAPWRLVIGQEWESQSGHCSTFLTGSSPHPCAPGVGWCLSTAKSASVCLLHSVPNTNCSPHVCLPASVFIKASAFFLWVFLYFYLYYSLLILSTSLWVTFQREGI